MGGPLELRGQLADDVRQAAAELGFEDAETYLTWLVSKHEEGEIVDESRIERIERRLDELEAKVSVDGAASGSDGRSENDRVQALIDENLPSPDGADDEAVSNAISEIEQQ